MEIQELTRWEIINGNYQYPKGMIKLIPTQHYYDRLAERGMGVDNIPSTVQVTRDNIYSGKTRDGKTITSVVIRLNYSKTKYLFLCLNPYDGGLKTMWFVDTTRRYDSEHGQDC